MSEDEKEQQPPANADYTAVAKQWLHNFEKVVRFKVFDFDKLRTMFHTKLVWFGLESNVCASLKQAIEEEFKPLWPSQIGFTCDLSRAFVFPDNATIFILIPWTCSSKIKGAPRKYGRATFVIAKFDEDKILCLNGHMSFNPVNRVLT